jgi:hypothetical protein
MTTQKWYASRGGEFKRNRTFSLGKSRFSGVFTFPLRPPEDVAKKQHLSVFCIVGCCAKATVAKQMVVGLHARNGLTQRRKDAKKTTRLARALEYIQ